VRELYQAGLEGRTAYNDAFVYTHGYGLVAAYGNQRSPGGSPVFLESNIPSTGKLGSFEPRVYFGEQSPTYSIVGAPKGQPRVELDYAASGASGQTSTTFTGDGGPSVGNLFNRLIYAIKFQSDQILLSNAVNSKSQILYDRDPAERVQKVAPYLTLDHDPYPSVVDGRIVWIVDGYTTSSSYPYSSTQSLQATLNETEGEPAYATDRINYIRNSVKATVDAYSGKVTLYAWDPSDPVLKAWSGVFPSTLKPWTAMSSQLMSHVRYPEDLFRMQRAILARYHVTNPGSWYQQQNSWRTPAEPTTANAAGALQPPYYLTMQMPDQSAPTYSLYSTYIPQSSSQSKNLAGYLAVDSNAGATKGTRAADYGQLRLLELPPDRNTVQGPGQEQNAFKSFGASQLNLLNRGDTSAVPGNLLTLPVGGGLLYVQPVYVRSTAETSYPILQKVFAGFGNKIAFEDTLDDALNTLFGGNSGANAGDNNVSTGTNTGGTGGGSTGAGSNGSGTGGTTTTNTALKKALADADKALKDRQAAYAKNDLVGAAQADARLQKALEQAIAAGG
jgi:uncharacterized membrane protein (UPF0182 family)